MRLIDADAMLEIITDAQKDYPITDRREIAKAMRIVLFELKDLINEQPTISQWIPVSERLLEEYVDVLVSPRFNDAVEGFFNVEGKWRDECGYYIEDVIAWMPLPEPYKEEE